MDRPVTNASHRERREHRREPLWISLQFRHAPTEREFPARSVDVSEGGMLLLVPATAPVQTGHGLTLTFGEVDEPIGPRLSRRSVHAEVVRVDRACLLRAGHVAVGARFIR